jgi:xanthine dehydrogenase iron-sulfur cluster and FAD-binding subunit A
MSHYHMLAQVLTNVSRRPKTLNVQASVVLCEPLLFLQKHFSNLSHASPVAQSNVVRAMSASCGKSLNQPIGETKPLNIQPPELACLIMLVTLKNAQSLMHADVKHKSFVSFLF